MSTGRPITPRGILEMQGCAGPSGLRDIVSGGCGSARTGEGVGGVRRLRDMSNVRRLDGRGEQLELAPKVGLSEPLLRPEEAAELLSVRISWIYEAVRSGRLPHLRVGRHIRFARSELDEWVRLQRVGARL
jgi:excisionase family DNA binding protein